MSMSSTSVVCSAKGQTAERCLDYLSLTKPRIVVLELVTLAVAAVVARAGHFDPWILLATFAGTGLVAASAGALNQWLEVATDAQMDRTAQRPLPAGRLAAWQVLAFGGVTLVVGLGWLWKFANPLTAALGLVTWVLYVGVYTPLKTRTPFNTVVGAIAGACPVLMGWAAAGGTWGLQAATLFLIVFLWQFPHFMAIAWMYREQYARAGMRMLSVVDPSGPLAGSAGGCRRLGVIADQLAAGHLSICGKPVPVMGARSGVGATGLRDLVLSAPERGFLRGDYCGRR